MVIGFYRVLYLVLLGLGLFLPSFPGFEPFYLVLLVLNLFFI